jgi:ParB family transcriptional regulator, chromosome partitioning protein
VARKKLNLSINPLFRGPSLIERNQSGSPYREVAIGDIDVDPDQPRRSFNEEALKELATSISEFGIINPILVKLTEGGTYRIIAGERRFRASKLAGLETVPVVVDSGNSEVGDALLAKQLVENLQREDLSSMERATAIGLLRDAYSLSVRDIGAKLGISKSLVQRSLDILKLPVDLQRALEEGLPESKVLLLAQISSPKQREKLLKRLGQISRMELEGEIGQITGKTKKSKKVSHRGTVGKLSVEDKRIAEEIQQKLGIKVNLSRNPTKAEQGKISLEFYSDDDLNEIYRRLT